MSISPIITFKAGQCGVDTSSKPYKVTPDPRPGYIYLYSEDDLIRFCWRERRNTMDNPELDLVMVPTDGRFEPYEYNTTSQPTSRTNGRIFALKFSSSSQRHLFWLQSKSQARNGDASWFSPRDLKIGQIVDSLLQGEEVDVSTEIAQVQSHDGGNDDDEAMEDVEGTGGPSEHHRGGSGGAGADATGGDIREEGSQARDGGADGGRAPPSTETAATAAVQNFLDSLKAHPNLSGSSRQAESQLYTTLGDLLPSTTTIPILETASPAQIDRLLSHLPPSILWLAQKSTNDAESHSVDTETAIAALSMGQKLNLLRRILRSPQFHQSLGSLTTALRDGGLPTIADALGVKVANGGMVKGGNVPLGGGEAVQAFVEGVKKTVEEEEEGKK